MTVCTSYMKRMLEPHPRPYPKCELGNHEWHGLETPSCPGPFGRLDECSASHTEDRTR